MGSLEGKKQNNIQRGKENRSRTMENDSPEHRRNDPSRELVYRGLGNKAPGRTNNGKTKLKAKHAKP